MSAAGDSGGRWARRLSVLVALVITGGLGAGLALLAAPGADAAYPHTNSHTYAV